MDRNALVWVLESCLLKLDDYSKKEIINFGCSEELANIGIKLYSYLINRNIIEGLKNGD